MEQSTEAKLEAVVGKSVLLVEQALTKVEPTFNGLLDRLLVWLDGKLPAD